MSVADKDDLSGSRTPTGKKKRRFLSIEKEYQIFLESRLGDR